MPKNYSPFLSVPYEVGDVLVICRTWLPDLKRGGEDFIDQDGALDAQWNEFLASAEGKAFSDEVDKDETFKRVDFKSSRVTFKVTNIYSQYVRKEITGIVKWSNVTAWPVGKTLTFVIDDTILDKYRLASGFFNPCSIRAKKRDNLWRATTETPLNCEEDGEETQRRANGWHNWRQNPILNNNIEYREEPWGGVCNQQKTYPHRCAQLKGNDTNFFTIEYAVQGRLIEFIKRMANHLKGRTVTKIDEMGYFTLGLRKKRNTAALNVLASEVSQEVLWSKTIPSFGSIEDMDTEAYFVLSAIGVSRPEELDDGARVATTENIMAYEVICYRSRYAVMEGSKHHLHNIKFRLRMTEDQLYGPNPHIEYRKAGDGATLHDDDGKPVRVIPEIYGFELRSHNRTQPVSSLTFNLHNRATNAFLTPRVQEHWQEIKSGSFRDEYEDKTIMPEPYLASDEANVEWTAALFIEYKPKSVFITVTEEGKPDEKIFKTIYLPTAMIPQDTPDRSMTHTWVQQATWGNILKDIVMQKQGLDSVDPIMQPFYTIIRALKKELGKKLAEDGEYDEAMDIFDILGTRHEGESYRLNDNRSAGEYWRTFLRELKDKIYGEEQEERRKTNAKAACKRIFEPWAMKIDPEDLMFKAICNASNTWGLYGWPKYLKDILTLEVNNLTAVPPKFSPRQELSIIQFHVASMNAKGVQTWHDMMNDEDKHYSRIWSGGIRNLAEDNTYIELHIGTERVYESTRGHLSPLDADKLKTLRVHLNSVSVLTDAQHHTDELVSSRMEIWKKRLDEYPEQMSFSMIHSVLADSNTAIDKAKCIALIKRYVPNSGLILGDDSIVHANTVPKEVLKDLMLQESGQSEAMNLNQSLWDFILYMIGKRFKQDLNIPNGKSLAKLRQYVYSFRLSVRDSQVSEKRVNKQQAAYTEGTLTLQMGQMDEYFENVSGHTFVLEKLNAKELNKSIGSHLRKYWMHPDQLMKLEGFTIPQCINFNIEVTLEPQQRRTYNAVEIVMNTAVGPLVSEARQIPTQEWDQTFKPALLKIKTECGSMDVEEDCNPFQPPNINDKERTQILLDAGFYWDDGGQLCHQRAGNGTLQGRNAWEWVKANEPGTLVAPYICDPLDREAVEARMTFIQMDIAGQVEGNHLLETLDLHLKRKDAIRNTFKYVRNLDTLSRDVYRKVPRSQKKITQDWMKYQKSQYVALMRGLATMPAGTNTSVGRDLHLITSGVLTPEQYESIEGNSLVGPFQSAEPYADETGQPGKMESDFWALSDGDIEMELDKDNYGRVGYLLNHFIRSRRCHQMDIANKWFKSTLSVAKDAEPHQKYALPLEGRFNYLRWQGSGFATKVGPNGNGTWPRSSMYITKRRGNLLPGYTAKAKKDRTYAFKAEINGVYQIETQQYVTHMFLFPAAFNKGIDWRAKPARVQFFSITDIELEWQRDAFKPILRVQGIANIINNIIYKRYKAVQERMKGRNANGLDQLEEDVKLVGKSSVENLIEKVWDEYSGFKGIHHIRMKGRSDYSLETAGFRNPRGDQFPVLRLPRWSSVRRSFNVKITLPGADPVYIYRDNVYVRNFFYVWRLKDKNKLNIDFGKFKLEYELKCEKVLSKNYGKLMGMGSLASYRGVDQTRAGLFLPENLPANEKFLNKENQHSVYWRLYDEYFYSNLVALFEINGFLKINMPIADSYKAVAIIDPTTKTQKIGMDGKPMIKMAPIDDVTYSMMGLWRKVETLTAARATQINNSDRVQNAMGEMYQFWNSLPNVDLSIMDDFKDKESFTNHIMEQHPQLRIMQVPSDETVETALGIPFTTCAICNQPGATVFLGRCSKNKDRPHCYHMSCLYDTIIKNPGIGGTSWQYKAINLDQHMSYITSAPGTRADTIYRDGNLTVREFLKLRSNMVGNGINREQSVTIPLEVDESVPCAPPSDDGTQRRWFMNAGKNHKRTVCGYFDDRHAGGDDWYKDIPMFKWRALLNGHADQSQSPPFKNTGHYVDECGGQEFHGTVTMTPNTAKCSECQMKFGSRIMCAFPRTREVITPAGQIAKQYAGQEVIEYGDEGRVENMFFGDVPKRTDGSLGYDFEAYKHKYLLMKYEPYGRAEIESTGDSHGGGSLELHVHDVSSYLESRPYKNKGSDLAIDYNMDKNLPQVLYPTPMLPGLEHPLIRKREEERGVKRQRAQPAKLLYGKPENLAMACLDKSKGKDWKESLMILFNKIDPTENGISDGPYTDLWRDTRGGRWAVYDTQSEEIETGNSNASTTKRPVEVSIPGTGEIVELPVYASGTGGISLQGGGQYNITAPRPEDILQIQRWCKLVEEQVGAVALEEKKEAQTGYEQWRDEILARNPGATKLSETKRGLKARFTVIPPGRPIKMNMEFPNTISLHDFIVEVKNNLRPVPTKAKLEIYIPEEQPLVGTTQLISKLTPKWFKTPTWPETIKIDSDMLGTVVEVPIFERDMDLEFPDEDGLTAQQLTELRERVRRYNEVKNHPDINTIEVSKIEYQGNKITKYNPITQKDEAVGFLKVYEGKMPYSGTFYLKDKLKKPKMRRKDEKEDQLPWFTPEYTEPFMVRCKPKKTTQLATRMKVEIAFVDGNNIDATIEVNKCRMIVDVPKDLAVSELGEYMIKCRWFQNPNCWLHKDGNGHPTLPDGRPLFKLRTLVSSSKNGFTESPQAYDRGDGTYQLYRNGVEDYDQEGATFFSEKIKDAKINLCGGSANDQNSRDEDNDAFTADFDRAEQLDQAPSSRGITFEELIKETLAWPADYEADSWFWDTNGHMGKFDETESKTYNQLNIPKPWLVSQLESRRRLENFDPYSTTHGITVVIQVPKLNKYGDQLASGQTYEWGNGTNRVLNHLTKQEGATEVNTNVVVATVSFHDWDGRRITENTGQIQAAIPLSYLMHKDGEEPEIPRDTDQDRWRKLYNWANLLSAPGRVFGDDRFYTIRGTGWIFDGSGHEDDRFNVDNIGQRGAAETWAILAQKATNGRDFQRVEQKKLVLAHQACMARDFYTLIKKEDDEFFGRSYEEKYNVLPVSRLLPMLRAKTRIIPISAYTQPGLSIRFPKNWYPQEDSYARIERKFAMVKQMKEDGFNPNLHEEWELGKSNYDSIHGWSNALTDGIILLQNIEEPFFYDDLSTDEKIKTDPLKKFKNVYQPDYCTAFLSEEDKEQLLYKQDCSLYIDVVRSVPRPIGQNSSQTRRAIAPTRAIAFEFVVVGPHEHRDDNGYYNACGHDGSSDNIRHFRGGKIHNMYLPVERSIQGGIGQCGFGYKDIHWHGFLQELPNVFCAEAACARHSWKLQEKEGDKWVDTQYPTEKRMEILLEQIEYVGTIILRDDRRNNRFRNAIPALELFHLSPNREGLPYGDNANYKLSVDECELVSLGISYEKEEAEIQHSNLYLWDQVGDTPQPANNEIFLRKSIRTHNSEERYTYTNGAGVAQSSTAKDGWRNLVFNPLNWTDKEENKNVYLNRACGVFPQPAGGLNRELPIKRGISKDGNGYNIQRALFGINNSLDGWRNVGATESDLRNGVNASPHFVLGVRVKNPEKYRLIHTNENNYDFNKHKEEDSDEESSDDDSDTQGVVRGDGSDNVYNLAIDSNAEVGHEWDHTEERVPDWPNVQLQDVVHCAYADPVYRVTRIDDGYVNLEQVEDPQQTVEDYPIEDMTFIHRAMTYPTRQHEIIRTGQYCRIRMGSMQAPGADALQAGTGPWAQDPNLSEKVYRIMRFGYGNRTTLRTDFERVPQDENLPPLNADEGEGDDGPIGATHQIMLRDNDDGMQYRTFISVIAYCDTSHLRIFGPTDTEESDEDGAAEEDIMHQYTYQGTNQQIKVGDIVMYSVLQDDTMVQDENGNNVRGNRFNVQDPREYSIVKINYNGDQTTFIIKLTMYTKLWDRTVTKSQRIIGLTGLEYIQFKRSGYEPIAMDVTIDRWQSWRTMPLTVGTLVHRCLATGSYMNNNTYIVTGLGPQGQWQGQDSGEAVELIHVVLLSSEPVPGAVSSVVNTTFLRWVGYQEPWVEGRQFKIGKRWEIQWGTEPKTLYEVIAVHRHYLGRNDRTNQIDMREKFNSIVVREVTPAWRIDARIRSIDLEDFRGNFFPVSDDSYSFDDLAAKRWPIINPWQEPDDGLVFTSESSEEDADLQEMDSRLSKITLKF